MAVQKAAVAVVSTAASKDIEMVFYWVDEKDSELVERMAVGWVH